MPVLFGGNDLPPPDEPGQKGGRPTSPPPGGGPGGVGGGFSGLFGTPGIGPGLPSMPGTGQQGLGVFMQKRWLPTMGGPPQGAGGVGAATGAGLPPWLSQMNMNGGLPSGSAYSSAQQPQGYADGGQVPGTGPVDPQPQDTQQIDATPGEIVMNPGVTSDPVISAFLTLMNILGAHHMGAGAASPSQGNGGSVEGFCEGGRVPGYAFGGPVGGAGFGGGGFGGYRPGGGGMGGGAPRQGAAPAQNGPPPAGQGQPGGGWGGRYTYNPEGGVTNVDPNNPWGTYQGNRDPGFIGQGARDLGGYGAAGYFDPRGNQMLLNGMLSGANVDANALQHQAMTSANLAGLDPAQQAAMKQQTLRNTQSGVQNIMAQTRAQALGSANDFAQGLYGQQLGGSLGFTGQTNQGRIQDWMNGNQMNRQNQSGGGFWGQLGGAVAGGVGQGIGGGGIGRLLPTGGGGSFNPQHPGYW